MAIKGYAMNLLHKVSKLMIKMMMMMRRRRRRRRRIIRPCRVRSLPVAQGDLAGLRATL